jgi:hypothetical protein
MTREIEIEQYLVKRVKQLGGIVRKVEWIGHRGAPDRMVAWPSRPLGVSFPIFVELKAPGQKPEPHQEREHARMREAGLNVVVIDSFEGVDALLGLAPGEAKGKRPAGMPDYTPEEKAAAFDALWETCGRGQGRLKDYISRYSSRPEGPLNEATILRTPRYSFEILAEGDMPTFRDVLHHLATRKPSA